MTWILRPFIVLASLTASSMQFKVLVVFLQRPNLVFPSFRSTDTVGLIIYLLITFVPYLFSCELKVYLWLPFPLSSQHPCENQNGWWGGAGNRGKKSCRGIGVFTRAKDLEELDSNCHLAKKDQSYIFNLTYLSGFF